MAGGSQIHSLASKTLPSGSTLIECAPMKTKSSSSKSKVLARILCLAALALPASAFGLTITLDNSNQQSFALDAARHFLYSGELIGPGGTKHLNVINTLTNTVVGNYSFSAGGYSSYVATSGTNVFWADQGSSLVRVLSVNAAGVPTATRNDSMTFATGIAALPGTYGVSLQGTGDVMRIVNSATGSILQTVNLGGVASITTSDPLANLYYVRSNVYDVKVINLAGAIVRPLTGTVLAIDPTPGRHFVYFESGSSSRVIQQLNGADDLFTGVSFDFGVGAVVTNVAVDAATGNVWASLQAQNRVVELDSNLAFIQQFTVPNAEAIAFDSGKAFVHQAGSNIVTVLVPEPSALAFLTTASTALLGFRRRRA